ncbi:MAG: hypothetical protein KatS3mg110_0525 [Pirellulaceae bacterium]|nr:MAG: hypothetical protein KatS3mg110_0525 [Pirellulaceae bacterium]
MDWKKLVTSWFGHGEWEAQVEHVARACADEAIQRLSWTHEWMSPAERHGYLRAKATPIVAAYVTLHARHWPETRREKFFAAVHDRAVALMESRLVQRLRPAQREAA